MGAPHNGYSKTLIYKAWWTMRERCSSPTSQKWHLYGARGIRVCERWRKFVNFLADMGERPSPMHTIDRIDPNGNYEPSNCRWATQTEQQRNRRNNFIVEFNGERMCIAEWAERTGIKQGTLGYRIRSGWSIERALTEPVRCWI